MGFHHRSSIMTFVQNALHTQVKTALSILAEVGASLPYLILNLIKEGLVTEVKPAPKRRRSLASGADSSLGEADLPARDRADTLCPQQATATEEMPTLTRQNTPTWELLSIPEDGECNHAYQEGLRMFYPIQHILISARS